MCFRKDTLLVSLLVVASGWLCRDCCCSAQFVASDIPVAHDRVAKTESRNDETESSETTTTTTKTTTKTKTTKSRTKTTNLLHHQLRTRKLLRSPRPARLLLDDKGDKSSRAVATLSSSSSSSLLRSDCTTAPLIPALRHFLELEGSNGGVATVDRDSGGRPPGLFHCAPRLFQPGFSRPVYFPILGDGECYTIDTRRGVESGEPGALADTVMQILRAPAQNSDNSTMSTTLASSCAQADQCVTFNDDVSETADLHWSRVTLETQADTLYWLVVGANIGADQQEGTFTLTFQQCTPPPPTTTCLQAGSLDALPPLFTGEFPSDDPPTLTEFSIATYCNDFATDPSKIMALYYQFQGDGLCHSMQITTLASHIVGLLNGDTCEQAVCLQSQQVQQPPSPSSQSDLRTVQSSMTVPTEAGEMYWMVLGVSVDLLDATRNRRIYVVEVERHACTVTPSSLPTPHPTVPPTQPPTHIPTLIPSSLPTNLPSETPSASPTAPPTVQPSLVQSNSPPKKLNKGPSATPTHVLSTRPSNKPTSWPTPSPTGQPSMTLSGQPSLHPSTEPSLQPSSLPSLLPTIEPTTPLPSITPPKTKPSKAMSHVSTLEPTHLPNMMPTGMPATPPPSEEPSSMQPSKRPSNHPNQMPPVAAPSVRESTSEKERKKKENEKKMG